MLAARDKSQIEIGYSWAGVESLGLTLLRSSGSRFVNVKNDSRYWAGM